MEKVFEAAGVRVTVELPEGWPEGVEPEIDLDAHPETEEQTRALVEAFGGVAAFRSMRDGSRILQPLEGTYGDPIEIAVWAPDETRPEPPIPFVQDLAAEQERAKAERSRAEAEQTPAEAG